MKILLIDNSSHFIEDLVLLLSDHEVCKVPFQQVRLKDAEEHDVVVLSGGGYKGEVSEAKRLYKDELDIIRHSTKPIFGICEGLQAIGAAFDSDFRKLPADRMGVNPVQIVAHDPIFEKIKRFRLMGLEQHHIAIRRVGEKLKVLGVSPDGVEIIKGVDRLIYGVQFHPEELQEGNNGHIFLQTFLEMVEGLAKEAKA